MKFIHCSDLHIDSPLRGLERYDGAPVDAMRGATRQALKSVVDAAIENKVDLVVIAGDVFDGEWRDFNTGLFFNAQLARLAPANIKVVLLKGNHDAASEISKSLRIPGHVTMLNHRKAQSVPFDDIGVVVHGQSFADRAVSEDLALQYPAAIRGLFNLGLLHTSLGGYAAHQTYAPTTLDVLKAKGYDYWALGHVHERQVLCETPRVVFCGNSQGRHARELGPKGCELVTYEGGEITNEFVPVDAVRWVKVEVDIAGLNDLDALLDATQVRLHAAVAHAGGRVLATRVVLTGSGKLHSLVLSSPEKVIGELRNMAIDSSDGNAWVEQVKRETRASYDRKAMEVRDDPIGELVRLSTQVEAKPAELEQVAREAFGPMLEKLPVEVREQINLEKPEQLKAILREAEAQVLGLLGGRTE
jgi:DNA repair exonuclease SbcCD nuclease subunit